MITMNKIKNIMIKNINLLLILLVCLVIYKNYPVIEGQTPPSPSPSLTPSPDTDSDSADPTDSMICPKKNDGYQYLNCSAVSSISNDINIDKIKVCLPHNINDNEFKTYNKCLENNNSIEELKTCEQDGCELVDCNSIKPWDYRGYDKWLSCLYSKSNVDKKYDKITKLIRKLKGEIKPGCSNEALSLNDVKVNDDENISVNKLSDDSFINLMVDGGGITGDAKPRIIDIDIDPELVPDNLSENIKDELKKNSTNWDIYLGQTEKSTKVKKINNYGLDLLYNKSYNLFESKNPLFDQYGKTRVYSNCKDNKHYCESVNSKPWYNAADNAIINMGVFMGLCRPEYGDSPLLNNPVIVYFYNILKNIVPLNGDKLYEINPITRLSCDSDADGTTYALIGFIVFVIIVLIPLIFISLVGLPAVIGFVILLVMILGGFIYQIIDNK